MVFKCLIVILLLAPLGTFASPPSEECASALKTLFANEVSDEEAAEFLKVQGDLTLHRLAWAYLKAQESDQTSKLENIESSILTLLDEKYTSTDPTFIKARDVFEAQPLSRTALAEIAPYLKELLSKEFGEEDQPFILNASDLKLLHALSKFEKSKSTNGKFDSRMLARRSPDGMLNFLKLVNSSYRVTPTAVEDALNVEVRLQGLEKTVSNLQKKLLDFVNTLPTPSQCADQLSCEIPQISDYFSQNEDIQKIFWDSLSEKLESDDLLLDNLTYGEVWLKTNGYVGTVTAAHAPIASQKIPPAVIKVENTTEEDEKPVKKTISNTTHHQTKVQAPRKTVIGTKTKYSIPSPVKGYYASGTGMYIEDPINVIVKDKKGRTHQAWESFDKRFLQKMSDAILNQDKVFEIDGHIYDRHTGKRLSRESVLKNFPPKKKEEYLKYLAKTDKSQLQSRQLAAMANGDRSFIFNHKLYSINGAELSPALTLSLEVKEKTGASIPTANFKKLDQAYLVERANAMMNNRPRFVLKNQVLDTETGRALSSPFRSIAKTQDTRMNKQRRINYENLSDKELVINFHRDHPKKDGCQHYAIIDKVNAMIEVHDLSGKKVFSTEVLVGNVRSDQRTVWTKYGEREKMTNRSTGAGIYTINKPRLNNDYYKRNYSNNILQLLDQSGSEQVFAIHQVPNGMPERYQLFGGSAEKRWTSSGCANLTLEDYKKITQWMKPSCQIYVLPEEPQNHFIIKDGKVQMVAKGSVKDAKKYNYNYGSKLKPITIRINNEEGRTEASKTFVKALETEKAKLMNALNLNNDEYNDLAMLAFGIMGQESKFGKSKKLWLKETNQAGVIFAKVLTDPFNKESFNTSRGYTQIKDLPPGKWREIYPDIKKSTLINPAHAAIATMAYLADAKYMLTRISRENAKKPGSVKITKENMVDFMGYIYQGNQAALRSTTNPATPEFNMYVQSLRKNMSYIDISQKIE